MTLVIRFNPVPDLYRVSVPAESRRLRVVVKQTQKETFIQTILRNSLLIQSLFLA